MQKCLGEILDEENDHKPMNKIMADNVINSDIPSAKILEPVSNDLGKCI